MNQPTTQTQTEVTPRSRGRAAFWWGTALCLLTIGAMIVQYAVLKLLFAPWYVPIAITLGAFLLLVSFVQRRTIVRFIFMALFLALAGFQWFMMAGPMSRLPVYEGAAKTSEHVPAFQTALADGRSFSDKDLGDSRANVITFFRGRW
jgi:hypothetical protein